MEEEEEEVLEAVDWDADFDPLLCCEKTRRESEETYIKNPLDADNLTRWGEALLELSRFRSDSDSKKIVQDAITKLGEALVIEPKKHAALWCIGNAYISLAFSTPKEREAKYNFDIAAHFFQLAVDEQPENEDYQKALEATAQAPLVHAEVHRLSLDSQPVGSVGLSAELSSKSKKSSDMKYDVMGWVILAIGVVAWVGFAKANASVSAPR